MIYQLRHIFYSIRPSACLGVGFLAITAHRPFTEFDTFIIFLSVFCGAACCFLINDIVDQEKDRFNQKSRPIATGELPERNAKLAAILFGVIYFLLSAWLGTFYLMLFVFTMAIFLVYPAINNRTGLFSNVIVAIAVVLSIIYGTDTSFFSMELWCIISATLVIIIAREIMLDGLDTKGDKAVGKPSIPLVFGNKGTLWVVSACYLIGSLPLLLVVYIQADNSLALVFLLSVLALWLPFLISILFKRSDWMLFNIRSSHLFFLLIMVSLLVR